jgi:hypothetical protein
MSPSLGESVMTSVWVANSLKAIVGADLERGTIIPVRSEKIFSCARMAADTATSKEEA